MRLHFPLLLAGLLLICPGKVQGQLAQNLQVELSPTSPTVRLNRPMLTLWTLRSQVDPIVEGRLLLDLHDGQTVFASYVIDDIVLTESQLQLTLLLAPVTGGMPLDEVPVRVRFETRGQVLELQPQILRVPSAQRNSMMALVGEPPTAGSRPRRRDLLIGKTQFETFAPEESEGVYQTVVVTLRPQDFPQSALAYCQFDTVYVLSDTLALLRGPQLDALRQWVRAGGSIYLELPRTVEPAQLAFLKSLTEESPEPLPWQLTRQGQIDVDALPPTPLLSLRCNLGRALVRISDGEPREDPLDSPEFRGAFAEFWRLSPPRVAAVLDHGNWDLVLRGQQPRAAPNPNVFQFASPEATDQTESAQVLAQRIGDYLSPRGLKLMPFWLIASMLGGLVVWIGPVEYIVLGRLRLRKWTWLTFPCAIVAMTVTTVWLANRAMTGVENGYAMQIFDYASDGDLVRSQSLSLYIPAVSGSRTLDVEDGLFADVSTSGGMYQTLLRSTTMVQVGGRMVQRQILIDPRTGRQMLVGGMRGLPQQADGPRGTTLVGRVPRKYSVTQSVKQWTPALSRTFSIPGRAPIAELDWSRLDAERLMTDDAFSRGFLPIELADAARKIFGPAACVAAILPRGVVLSDGRNDPLIESAPPAAERRLDANSGRYQEVTPAENWREFLIGATVIRQPAGQLLRETDGLRGGGILQDLTLIDADAKQWVLVVAVPRGQTVEVHRKLYPLPESMQVRRRGI